MISKSTKKVKFQ